MVSIKGIKTVCNMSGVDTTPMQEVYENTLKGDMNLDKKIVN